MVYHGGYEKAAPYYDLFDNKKNITFFYHYAKKAGAILDIGSGTGRIAIPLAQKGIKVWCIEPSPGMVLQFKQKLAYNPGLMKNINIIRSTAGGFKLTKKFPAAFLSGTFDHFLTDQERITALENITSHLIPGSILVFDVYLGLMKNSDLHAAGRVVHGNKEYRRYIKNTIISDDTLEILLVYEIHENRKMIQRIEQKSQAAIITRAHIHDLLQKVDLKIKNEYSDFAFNTYRENDGLLIVETFTAFSRPLQPTA